MWESSYCKKVSTRSGIHWFRFQEFVDVVCWPSGLRYTAYDDDGVRIRFHTGVSRVAACCTSYELNFVAFSSCAILHAEDPLRVCLSGELYDLFPYCIHILHSIVSYPFEVLHGGVSALVAESLACMGAHVASGFGRVAGVHLSIHHLKSANLGEIVYAEAKPLNVGKSIHVWEVNLWKKNSLNLGERILISSSRVTIKTNMPIPKNVKDTAVNIKKYAKL
ncbi:1,4-dihydroxy-2-naphthoyl-CoA thioesterase 1-like [Solanum stenotomum]|uniref:1,4-dihydroxy-2-naphthoyl-CoA thioesterase 1-like n=1 Tax=Solanum stenotomum TaxID=172797 RepID=UPI0020D10A5F|nr:1,4-dihydroxy-2-naphthoyl-CoA thioesterase 1-like [Solanum stenotomum]